jgi:DNA-binding transcriptional regulator YdaS (Cro superfamily)
MDATTRFVWPGPNKLRGWRLAQTPKRSQGAVALAAGVKQPTVAEWEKGTRRPSLAHALKVEAATGGEVTVEDFGRDRTTGADLPTPSVDTSAAA